MFVGEFENVKGRLAKREGGNRVVGMFAGKNKKSKRTPGQKAERSGRCVRRKIKQSKRKRKNAGGCTLATSRHHPRLVPLPYPVQIMHDTSALLTLWGRGTLERRATEASWTTTGSSVLSLCCSFCVYCYMFPWFWKHETIVPVAKSDLVMCVCCLHVAILLLRSIIYYVFRDCYAWNRYVWQNYNCFYFIV